MVGIVYAELSMSLDGYIAGPNVGTALPPGEHGELLHEWMWRGRTDAETTAFEETLLRRRRCLDHGPPHGRRGHGTVG